MSRLVAVLRFVLAVTALFATTSGRALSQTPDSTPAADTTSAAVRDTTAPVPVVVGGDTLFVIAQRIGPFPPEARVRAVESRLSTLIRDPFLKYDEVRVFHGESASQHTARIYGKLHENIQDRCAEAGIVILSPSYGVRVRPGDSLFEKSPDRGAPP